VGSPGIQDEGRDKLIALDYTLFTPFLNPILYTLHNKEVKGAVRRVHRGLGLCCLDPESSNLIIHSLGNSMI
jgi:hypothetical protein